MKAEERLEWLMSQSPTEPRRTCPFCGHPSKYVNGGYPIERGQWQEWWLVQCTNEACGIWASGPSPKAAADKWNKRVESDQAWGAYQAARKRENDLRDALSTILKRFKIEASDYYTAETAVKASHAAIDESKPTD